MAIEGIASAVSTYQPQQVTKTTERRTDTQSMNYQNMDGSVNEISRDTRIVSNAGDANNQGNREGQEQKQPSEETMRQALSDINKKLNNTECVFGVHEQTNRVMIRIVDKDTKEVIKELPPEKTLNMIAKVWELAGLLVDEKL